MSEQQLDLEAIKGRIRKAHDMVHALCQPKYSAGTREWLMSIPARPDYDPDLVIGDALNGADKLVTELHRTREALAVERRVGALIRNRVIGYELVNGVCPVCDGVCAEDSDQVTHGKGCPMAFAAEQEEGEAKSALSKAPTPQEEAKGE